MKKRKEIPRMLIPTIIMGILAAALLLIAYFRGEGEQITGMRLALP